MKIASARGSIVMAAGHRSSAVSKEAMSKLCQDYWYPLYAFVRRKVGDPHKAHDLTQAFFQKLLEKNYIAAADPERGRFRAFLLTALKRFMANEWDKEQAQKRGGGKTVFSLDFEEGERRYALEPADDQTPDHIFQRTWVTELLERVLGQLRQEFDDSGKSGQFDALKYFIVPNAESGNYSDVAKELGISSGAARVAAHRLRGRYRELLRETIAQTVTSSEEVEDEIRSLFDIFFSPWNMELSFYFS